MAQESAELDVSAVVVLGCGGGGGFHAVGVGVKCNCGRYPWAGGEGGIHAVGVGVEADHKLRVCGVFGSDCGMGRARLGLQRLSLSFLLRSGGLQLRPRCL